MGELIEHIERRAIEHSQLEGRVRLYEQVILSLLGGESTVTAPTATEGQFRVSMQGDFVTVTKVGGS